MVYKIEKKTDLEAIYISWEYGDQLEDIFSEKRLTDIIHYEGKGKNTTDVLYFSEVGVINHRTKKEFEEMGLDNISYLPYTFYELYSDEILGIKKTIDAFLYKIDYEIDCIDYEKSDLFTLSDKKIRGIDKLVLKKEEINNDSPMIFKVKGVKFFICCNELMKNKIEEIGLKGIKFLNAESYTF